ncbi:GNAT family N-acetyltransferase [Terracoccus sp. 273MFTsu3.1]|uniref:GNAT family N-acetyltransferase n=1 Tax=Terracoccus sp. 273MFTsu3.1 TaxID=1172188 RepID=UPI00037C7022|nr:GNAT family N-acetyltransferase [Terracoccus sp. 273MFTsu3.1]
MTAPAGEASVWLTTERLVLRRPRAEDLDDYVRLHSDPRTYAHSPSSMTSPERCRERLADDVADWERDGLGYAAVVDRGTGAVIGWAGLRHKDSDASSLNLYYRLAHDRLGAGLGREISRAVVAWGVEHCPDALVTAMVDTVNTASLRTAVSAGLVQVGSRQMKGEPDSEPMPYFVAPSVASVPREAVGPELCGAVVDLWVRVNDAGGSVGFLPGAARRDVAAALDRHLADVHERRSQLCVLREPTGALLGLGFWEHSRGFPYDHVAGLKRLMVDPAAQRRNLGRILLGGMVGIARRELPWVELLRLDYRDGLGLGDFYARAGWTEVGRVPRGLRLSATDYRDDVAMARRVDGRSLR